MFFFISLHFIFLFLFLFLFCFVFCFIKNDKYIQGIKGAQYPWALFLETLCIFSKNKATLDKVSYGSGQKCSKELKNHSFTSVETTVVKL